jgi:hypothetical protein
MTAHTPNKNIIEFAGWCRPQQQLLLQEHLARENLYSEFALMVEWCSGGNLRTLLDTSGSIQDITDLHLVEFARSIACGMEFLHKHEKVHLDLKPENVLFKTCALTKRQNIDQWSYCAATRVLFLTSVSVYARWPPTYPAAGEIADCIKIADFGIGFVANARWLPCMESCLFDGFLTANARQQDVQRCIELWDAWVYGARVVWKPCSRSFIARRDRDGKDVDAGRRI